MVSQKHVATGTYPTNVSVGRQWLGRARRQPTGASPVSRPIPSPLKFEVRLVTWLCFAAIAAIRLKNYHTACSDSSFRI